MFERGIKMKDFIEFRDLEKLLKQSPPDYLSRIKSAVSNKDHEKIIELIKLSGVCIDIYGNQQNKKILDQVIEIVQKGDPNKTPQIEILRNDIFIFDQLFNDFQELRNISQVNNFNDSNQVSAFIISSEIFLASLQDYGMGMDFPHLEEKYPFIIAFGNGEGKFAPPEKVVSELIHLNNDVMEQVGEVLKYLIYKGMPWSGVDTHIPLEEIKMSRRHFDLLSRFEVLCHIHENWRFCGGTFINETKTRFKYLLDNIDDYIAQRVSVFRARSLRNKWMQDFVINEEKLPINPETKITPPNEFRTSDEYLSAIFCNELFGSEDLSEHILGISLGEWIRAYTILKQISITFLTERKLKIPLTIRTSCIAKTRKEWADIFQENGFEKNKVEIIIDNLVFTKNSKDLIDCPFIPIDDELVIIPSIVVPISPADAMLSNFYQKELTVNFRGKGFENRFIVMLSSNNIQGKNLKTIDNGNEYECDVAFVLDDDLYFIECKTFLQPETPRRYFEFIDKITEATNQLNRISNFYAKNLQIVKNKLGLSDQWVPRSIQRVVVSSAMLGEPSKINGCFITDFSIMRRFFDRENPGLSIGKVRINTPDKNYEGIISSEKLINIMTNPAPISIIKNIMKKTEREMTLNKISIKYDFFEENELIIPDKDSLVKLAQSLNIPYEELIKHINGEE